MKKIVALLLCAVLAAGLCGCNKQTDSVTNDIYAEKGGAITLPEGMDTSRRFVSQIEGDTLFLSFNQVQTRNTGYFQTEGDTITLTSYATTESTGLLEYKAGLWELTNDGMAQYVEGCTLYFTTGGDCYTGSFSGLDPNVKYKITLSYDSSLYKLIGAMKVEGLANAEAVEDEESDSAAA